MFLCATWSYCHQTPTASMSHPICHLTQQQSPPYQQMSPKLGHGFNTYETSTVTFRTGWVSWSTCREISCFPVERCSLSSFLASGHVQPLFHHLLLLRLVAPTGSGQGWPLQLLWLTLAGRTAGHRWAVCRTVTDSDNN